MVVRGVSFRGDTDQIRPGRQPHPKTAEILHNYRLGVCLDEIVARFGISERTIHKMCRKYKIPPRRPPKKDAIAALELLGHSVCEIAQLLSMKERRVKVSKREMKKKGKRVCVSACCR